MKAKQFEQIIFLGVMTPSLMSVGPGLSDCCRETFSECVISRSMCFAPRSGSWVTPDILLDLMHDHHIARFAPTPHKFRELPSSESSRSLHTLLQVQATGLCASFTINSET